MLEPAPSPQRHILLRVAARVWRFGLRSASVAAIFLLWVICVFELYVCQFFHYIPGVGWLIRGAIAAAAIEAIGNTVVQMFERRHPDRRCAVQQS